VSENQNPDARQGQTATLSRELSDFLLELSIGVHRYSMYPLEHPSLRPAAANVVARLTDVLAGRKNLSIGVGSDQLLIDGVATESRHPVLRDLAKRLHEHQLGGVSFSSGTRVREVESLLQTLSQDPDRDGDPLGLLPSDQLPTWEHIRLFPVGYGQLELAEDDASRGRQLDRATGLWLSLAKMALEGDDSYTDETASDPSAVAHSIKSHRRQAAYDEVIVNYLLQLAEELKVDASGEAESVRRKVSNLVRELDEDTLQRLVALGGNDAQRRRFVLDANQSLAVDSVVKLVRAAAGASQQTISHSLTRLLMKLSSHADAGPARIRDQADAALRDNVEGLIREWDLSDPNPDGYTLILDSMARAAPVFNLDREEEDGESLSGAHRLIQMSLEVDTWGPTVAKGVSDLVDAGEVGYLLQLADGAPDHSRVAPRLIEYLTSPTQLRRILSGEDVHEETLNAIVGRMGTAAIPTLMDVLAESESRAIRRQVFDALAGFGEVVGPQVVARLDDARWFVIRNLLALLKTLPVKPQGFSPGPFLSHEDPRVRREAFALAVRESGNRERTLALGLADPDDRMLRIALRELQKALPETLVPVLVSRVVRAGRDPDLRVMAVKALRHSRSNLALEVLLEVCDGGKTILGKVKLPPASRELLAALRVLGEGWSDDQRARETLSAARRAKDARIREALSGGGWEE
jgi:hypothetical protein